jgi:polyisoprenoid-binding protein YceI
MKNRYRIAAALVAVGLMTSGCAENPADKVPAASVATPTASEVTETPVASDTATPGDVAMEGTVYALVENAEVNFTGSKVTGSHEGGFKGVKGSVTVPEEQLDKATVDLVIDMTTVYTDDEKLTGHLKSEDFFGIEAFPESTFKSTSVTKTDDGFEVTGALTLHGVTKTITFPAQMMLDGETLKTSAEFAINRKDFGIVYPGKPDDLIRDEVVIKYDLAANKASG